MNKIQAFSKLCVLWHSSHADGTRIQSWPSPRLLSSSDEELELSSEADESRPELVLGRNTFILGPFCAAPLLLRKGEKLLSTWASRILDSDLEAVWGNNAWSGLADSTTVALSSKVAALFHVVDRRGIATLLVRASKSFTSITSYSCIQTDSEIDYILEKIHNYFLSYHYKSRSK